MNLFIWITQSILFIHIIAINFRNWSFPESIDQICGYLSFEGIQYNAIQLIKLYNM